MNNNLWLFFHFHVLKNENSVFYSSSCHFKSDFLCLKNTKGDIVVTKYKTNASQRGTVVVQLWVNNDKMFNIGWNLNTFHFSKHIYLQILTCIYIISSLPKYNFKNLIIAVTFASRIWLDERGSKSKNLWTLSPVILLQYHLIFVTLDHKHK